MIYTVIIRQEYVADHLFHVMSDAVASTPEFRKDVFHKCVAALHRSNMEYWADKDVIDRLKKASDDDVVAESGNLPNECSLVAVFPGVIEPVDGEVI